jgi:hypothetical protein
VSNTIVLNKQFNVCKISLSYEAMVALTTNLLCKNKFCVKLSVFTAYFKLVIIIVLFTNICGTLDV